jgi:hypothetical protein
MRVATAVRLLVGTACLARPTRVLELVGGLDRDDTHTRAIVRVLGGRLLVQSVADLAIGPRTRVPDVWIDGSHAASMVAAAFHWPEHRRSALTSAAVASAIAVLDAGAGRRRAA